MVEVPINSPAARPYQYHEASKNANLEDKSCFELSINTDFHDVAEFANALRDLYHLYTQKGHSYEDNLDAFIFQHYDFAKQVRSA